MAKPQDWQTLSKLVGLKRSKAEQAFARARTELETAEAGLAALQAAFQKAAPDGTDFAAHSLSERYGHSRRLIALMEAQKTLITAKQTQVIARREDLKQAFGAEQRVKDIQAGRK